MLTRIADVPTARATDEKTKHWFRLVTPRRDAHGTVILPEGGKLERFKKNPAFLWMHQSMPRKSSPQTPPPEAVIGKVIEVDQTRDYLDVHVEFDVADELPRRCLRKVNDGFLRAVSVGFDDEKIEEVVVSDPAQAEAWGVQVGETVPVIREWNLLEASLVIIGSNEDALAVMRMIDPTEEPAEPVGYGDRPEAEERAKKPKGKVVPYAHEGIDDGPWDAAAAESAWRKASSSDGSGDWDKMNHEKYSQIFAYVADDGASPSDYKLPHHSVSHGKLLVNKKGVSAAIGAVNGARGGVSIPENHKKAVLAHLEKHQEAIMKEEGKKSEGSESEGRMTPEGKLPASNHIDLPPVKTSAGAAGPPYLPAETANVLQPKVENEMPKRMMSMEHRWIARGLIGHHMEGAAGHMRAMEHAKHEEHRAFHEKCAGMHIEHARAMAGHLRDGYDDGDEDDMRAGARAETRSIGEKAGNADLRSKFAEVAQAIKEFDTRSVGEVCQQLLGTDDAEKIDAKIEGLLSTQERFKVLASEVKASKDDAAAGEREKIVTALLDGRLMTPAQGKRARDEKWSLVKLGEFKAQAEQGGPVIEINRVRGLAAADPAPAGAHAAPAQSGLVPAPIPVGQGAPTGGTRMSAGAQGLAAALGLDPEKTRLRAEMKSAEYRGDLEAAARIKSQLG